ncbi:hypothetical protein JK358_33930 [Nocardia sp. 2]|uniref:Uncharacterized protein n=1 Tax=Nocardia acididurans TaxID=2802282 RepID=A0ABS1MFS4_9NOCA|nr:hypothetical protein [Nocardia acididurans]MBL1079417.1 hypothetical protein [Nocardia acididurans]
MEYSRRLARAVCTVTAVASLAVAGSGLTPAAAETDFSPQPPDPAYVLNQVVEILGGTVTDVMRPGMLDYFVKAGIMTAAGNWTEAFEDLAKPETYNSPDSAFRLASAAQKIFDTLAHVEPAGIGFPPHPDYLPDWNHDGKFGIADTAGQLLPGFESDTLLDGEYDRPEYNSAKFRYPCMNPDGSVWYETTSGACAPGDSGADFKLGDVQKFRIINSRGISMAAMVWMPYGAMESDRKYPVAVGAPGAAESMNHIGMYAQSAARNGFMTVTFGQSGQPDSDGNALDMVLPVLSVADCFAPGSCRDVQDAVRWVFNEPITPVIDLGNELNNILMVPRVNRQNPAYETAGGANMSNPWLDRMDLNWVSLFGQSVGAVGTSNYLNWQVKGYGIDGRPLPRVRSASVMSGYTALVTDVPLQMQTADLDIPGLSGYGITNFYQPFFNATDGPFGTMDRHHNIVNGGTAAPVQTIVYESGSHGDSINWVGIPRNIKSPALSVDYSMAWFNCYGRPDADTAACDSLSKPRDGLSRAFASEYSPQGIAGPTLCMRVPDRASIGQVLRPEWFIDALNGRPRYTCTPQS